MTSTSQRHTEKERLEALHQYQILDSGTEETFDSYTELASVICNTPVSLLSLVDENRVWCKSSTGVEGCQFPRELSYCTYTIESNEGLYVENIQLDSRFNNTVLQEQTPFPFYCGYPVTDPNGVNLGALCVLDTVPRQLSDAQKKALQTLAKKAANAIVQRRKQIEDSYFESLFRLSNDLLCIAGTNGYFKRINPAFMDVLGWNEEYLLGNPITALIHPDDIEKTSLELDNISHNRGTKHFTNRYLTKEGRYVYLEWVTTLEIQADNIYAIARDVTTEVLRERKLAASEKSFRDFFESSPGLMCTHDEKGRFLTINQAGADVLGYTREELLTRSLFDIVPEERHSSLSRYLQDIQVMGRSNGIMQTIHRNGSKRIWLFHNVLERLPDGRPYIIGNATDITTAYLLEEDLKRTKEMLEQSSSLAGVGAWEVNLIKKTLFWSDEVKRIHKTPRDFTPDFATAIGFYKEGLHRDSILGVIRRAIEKGESWDLEVQIIAADGSPVWVRTIGHAEHKNGVCIRIYGAIQNVNNHKLIELDNLRTRQLAIDASSAKSEFLANMSHEIRTPLNGIIGFTDLVLKTQLNDTQQQYLTIVNQSASALLSIINDILDFSKIEAGKLELSVERCDVFQMMSQAADVITYQAQQKQLEVLLNVEPDSPRFIQADAVRLKQVLVNLLGNAVKFTDRGEIELKIHTLEKISDTRALFRFEVRDTGIGIRTDKQEKIYEAFLQEDASTTKKYGGTGLGLAISNKLLGLMGSKLQLNSAPGKGSTFFFDVAFDCERAELMTDVNLDAIKHVLIVDDNENNRFIIRQMLLLKNIHSTEARNGFEALQLLASGGRFDAVVMDYHMPYMNGLDTIRKIKEVFAEEADKMPLLLLHSSSDDETIGKACHELDVRQRLIKPVKMQDLYMALSLLMTQSEATVTDPGNAVREQIEQPLKVLIAEDNPVNMLLAKTVVLRIAPHAIIMEAANGEAAVSRYRRERPDIVLMDIQMPVMNGYEATKVIREMQQTHTPIIALTAANVKGERENCIAAGMDEYISKPFVEETIMNVFSRFVTGVIKQPVVTGTAAQSREHLNRHQLETFTGNDSSLMKELLELTLSELDKSCVRLLEFSGEHSFDKLKAAAHKLYGTAVSVGMDCLSPIAKQIETCKSRDEQEVGQLVQAAVTEIKHVQDTIHEIIATE